ncbi:hypothetical protein O0I10_009600 [Lichtheimia ornata]|uniref:Uncharacterized protein n=1 Tax=Lichtheimia ornata TaxID=688661 RepID=A0AAD7XUA0_9FUNG|nr:uncharacterized protein O0I10_009600 [Lichtheimia ornata]KAJ8654710.1 hypothetical protein O0I10_009600 [Lichtheimia ornata]
MALDTNNNQQPHATTTTLITNKGDESALPMYIADNNDQRMAALEDWIHLLERVFRSYCVDDEVFYLLNESVRPPETKQCRHGNNVSSQQARLGCFFRRTSPMKSNSQRQRWIRVPNAAGRQTDLLSTSSSISPLEEPESDTSKSPTS